MTYKPDTSHSITGHAVLLPDNVRAGMIVSIGYRGSFNRNEFREHCFENLDPLLKGRIAHGDVLVTGKGFANGETGEESVMALTGMGVSALVAVSVNRIFLRNAINHGFPVVILPIALEMISDGDLLEIDPVEALVRNTTKGLAARGKILPQVFLRILAAGGIVNDVLMKTEKKKG